MAQINCLRMDQSWVRVNERQRILQLLTLPKGMFAKIPKETGKTVQTPRKGQEKNVRIAAL